MMKHDWEAGRWTVPVNLGVSRTTKLGKTPWRLGLEVNYYIERSDRLGQDWMIGLNLSPVVPNILAKWLGAAN
jgi:hypothetical protein